MNISAWTQDSDYSLEKPSTLSFTQATEAIRSFPWNERVHAFVERLVRNEDACPPGIGFNTDNDTNTFHLYGTNNEEWHLHLSLQRPGKILGLFRKPPYDLVMNVDSLDKAIRLLGLFYSGDMEQLEQFTVIRSNGR